MDISDEIVLYLETEYIGSSIKAGPWYKIVEDCDKFKTLPVLSVHNIDGEYSYKINIYSYKVLKDYVLFRIWDEDNRKEKYHLVHKKDSKPLDFFNDKTKIRRFRPGPNPSLQTIIRYGSHDFFVDTDGNVLIYFLRNDSQTSYNSIPVAKKLS